MEKQAACAGVAVDVRVYPYLAASLIEEDGGKPAEYRPDRRPRVGFLGGTRRDRGAHLLPELVLKAERHGLDVDWSFQLDLDLLARLMDSDGGWQARELVNCDTVTVHEGRLTVEEYAALLNDVDAVVLPYDSRYETSGSGVFYEALWLGKTIFVPENSSMARVLDEIKAPEWRLNGQDVDSLVAVLEDFSRNKKAIMEKSLQSGKVWRAEKSPFQKFRQQFLECVKAGSL